MTKSEFGALVHTAQAFIGLIYDIWHSKTRIKEPLYFSFIVKGSYMRVLLYQVIYQAYKSLWSVKLGTKLT